MKNKLLTIGLSVVLLLVTASIALTASDSLGKIPSLTQYNYNAASKVKPYTVGDILRIDSRINEVAVGTPTLSFCAEADAEKLRKTEITPEIVNDKYFENYKLPEADDDSAVISEELSLKLFFNKNAGENTIKVLGKSYKIAGTYKDCFDDGKNRVYVLYSGVKNAEKYDVTELAAKNGSTSAVSLEQMHMKHYYGVNLSEKKKIITDFLKITGMMFYFALLFAALRLRKYMLSRSRETIGESLSVNYALKSFRKNPRSYLGYLFALIGIPVGAIVIFALCGFSIYIIPGYIPYDNIFDIPHYLSMWQKSAEELRRTALLGNTFYLRLYQSGFNSLCHQLVTELILIAAVYKSIFYKSIFCKKAREACS